MALAELHLRATITATDYGLRATGIQGYELQEYKATSLQAYVIDARWIGLVCVCVCVCAFGMGGYLGGIEDVKMGGKPPFIDHRNRNNHLENKYKNTREATGIKDYNVTHLMRDRIKCKYL